MVPNGRYFLVVGAGFAGSVVSQQLAERGHNVVIIDKRDHIGGNAHDRRDAHGILVHPYGPHIFHTNADRIVEYLSRFTEWRPYEHRVLASIRGELYPIPINRTTLERFFDVSLADDDAAQAFLESLREVRMPVQTSEDVVIGTVGRELFEAFFAGYTRKQWGMEAKDLDASVTARIPVRTNTDDRYFGDKHQVMPLHGYTAMFERMLSDERITVELGVDYKRAKERYSPVHTIYTGPIDEYFDYSLGRLPYRSLLFEHEHVERDRFQPVGTVNYPLENRFTRITEFKHLTGQESAGTSIVREYPSAEGDPYYPVPNPATAKMYAEYAALAESAQDVTFVGRLAQYRYYNMDQVVGAALSAAEKLVARFN